MKHYARVLFAMDGESDQFETLKQVLDLAENHQLALTLFDVTEKVDPANRFLITAQPLGVLRDRTLRNRLRNLEALVSMIERRSCTLQARTSFGNRAKEIVSEAARGNHDLVIKRREKGSTDQRVMRDCQCPVWVLGPEDFTESGQIIAANAPRLASRHESHAVRMCAQGS